MPILEYEMRGSCALIYLNRPEVRNAICNETIDQINKSLDQALADGARAVIFAGRGKGFCAGTDLKEMTEMGLPRYLERVERVHQLFQRLRDYPLVSIAAVHGAALGGGTELAVACTFRVASQNAVFGLPEIRLGVMPSYGGTQLVSRLIGENRALELMLTARQVDAREALALGLVNRSYSQDDDIVDKACEFAGEMAHFSLVAQQGIRATSAISFDGSLPDGMAFERGLTASVFASDDAQEGVAAFLEKRQPSFKDC